MRTGATNCSRSNRELFDLQCAGPSLPSNAVMTWSRPSLVILSDIVVRSGGFMTVMASNLAAEPSPLVTAASFKGCSRPLEIQRRVPK
jgi:hypothetical protein